MTVLKHNGKVYGANLTATERRAMEMEIQRQLGEYDKKHELELVATVLWVLVDQYGFGEKRLRRFFDSFDECIEKLVAHYMLESEDRAWLCTEKLLEHGIDISKWKAENEEKRLKD